MSARPASVIDPPARSARIPPAAVLRLAVADLRHEWVLSFCVSAALAAVLAPLLLLFGLKFGTIETLRDRLIQDPVNREIRPAQSGNFGADWFAELRRLPAVGFVTPTIARGADVVSIVRAGSREPVSIDMVATAPGDPLLAENGIPSPGEGEAVLSAEAMAQLGVSPGGTLRVQANRSSLEVAEASLRLVATLPARADDKPRLYVPLQFTVDVQSYRRGAPVPARGWPGAIQQAAEGYDGAYILVEAPLDALTRLNVTVGTGFSAIEELPAEEFQRRARFPLGPSWRAYDLHVLTEPARGSSLAGLRDRLRGRGAIVVPYVRDVTLTLPGGERLPVLGWSLSEDDAARLGSFLPPWQAPAAAAGFAQYGRVLLPSGTAPPSGPVTIVAETMLGRPALPLEAAGTGPEGVAVVPTVLAGMLRAGARSEVLYDPDGPALVLGRPGFSGFRLYARTIDDVLVLADWLRGREIAFSSRAQDIDRIRVLDRGLTRMFWLVAVVGIIGGAAALIASLYASVQRKRRDLGMMRLLGIPRRSVFLFPVYQSAMLAGIGATAALAGYGALAAVINMVFAGDLNLGQRICRLPPAYLAMAVAAMLGLAVLCALMAARAATRVDPAEAIRDE